MTEEQAALRRIEGKVDAIDGRLRSVETSVTALTAVDAERVRQDERAATSTRWIVGLAITSGLSLSGLVLAIFR